MRDNDAVPNKLDTALTFAEQGNSVFPAYGINGGRCACGDTHCRNPGKHPMTPHGLSNATDDLEMIRQWWGSCPNANIALRTGSASGIVVLDVDLRHDGHESLISLQEEFGSLPDTVAVITGSGGSHYYFRHPGNGAKIPCATGLAGWPGLDIRGDGGYVITVGSDHISGSTYQWEVTSSPDIVPLAPLPQWILGLLTSGNKTSEQMTSRNEPGWVPKALGGVSDGERNRTATKLAGYFRNKHSKETTFQLLKPFAGACQPPLALEELGKCVDSVYRYSVVEEEIAPVDEDLLPVPSIPEEAWVGLFADYRDAVGPTTEASDSYHYASLALGLGATLGRRIFVYHARELYPNFNVCLVGRSGIARKDTAWDRKKRILEQLHADDMDSTDPVFQIIPGLGSVEGLIDALGGTGKVVILNESEFLSLLSKAKQDSLSNIIPKLTSLYDCPNYETLKTRKKAVVCREPFLSIFSGTTLAWLQMGLSQNEIYGGFANRFMFICGDPKEPMPFPPKADPQKIEGIVQGINDVRQWADDLKGTTGGEVSATPEARGLFSQFYAAYHKRCSLEGLNSTLIARIQTFIWKLSLLYAAMEFSDQIRLRHMECALAAGDFLEKSMLNVFQSFNESKSRQKEREILLYLQQRDALVPKREMYRALHMSARHLDEIAKGLKAMGLIRETRGKSEKGRSVECYELVK